MRKLNLIIFVMFAGMFFTGVSLTSAYGQSALDQLQDMQNTGVTFDGSDGERSGMDIYVEPTSGNIPEPPEPEPVEGYTDYSVDTTTTTTDDGSSYGSDSSSDSDYSSSDDYSSGSDYSSDSSSDDYSSGDDYSFGSDYSSDSSGSDYSTGDDYSSGSEDSSYEDRSGSESAD